jgi:hypothetical protein
MAAQRETLYAWGLHLHALALADPDKLRLVSAIRAARAGQGRKSYVEIVLRQHQLRTRQPTISRILTMAMGTPSTLGVVGRLLGPMLRA